MSSKVSSTDPRAGFPQSSFTFTPLEHVRTLYIQFVKGLFYGLPQGFYHWEPNPSDSDIAISDENPIHLEEIGNRPAISFTRGPTQFYSLGLDDMSGYNFETGQKQRSVLVPGTMHINCCSRVDIEGDNLAWFVAEMLWLHREILMKAGFFEIGRQPMIGAPSPAGSIVSGDSADEWYCTTVTTPFQFYRTSQITPLNTGIVRGINLALNAQIPSLEQSGISDPLGVPLVGHDLQANVTTTPPPPFVPASDVYGGTPNPEGAALGAPTRIPHPLNPAVMVMARSSRRFGPALRPPSIRGRTIPIVQSHVEGSLPPVVVTSTHKV